MFIWIPVVFIFFIVCFCFFSNIILWGDFFLVFFNFNSLNFNISFSFLPKLFFFSLLIIFLSIMFYCIFYIDKFNSVFYIFLMMIFCFSMIVLIFHNNIFSFLLGWDGLGVSSYFLVLYYNNWSAVNSAFVTVMSNRLGDSFMMLFLMQSFFLFNFNTSFFFLPFCFFVLFVGGITKSAMFPFSSWLPLAMAAPTPTSSLVHSSTLVTAGIFLFLKYFTFFMNSFFMFIFFLFGGLTIFISGLVSLVETDCKKVIALSTLNQLGFMVFCMSTGNKTLVFFHLITHAFFKSCMFIQMGFFIHNNFCSQDFRVFSLVSTSSFLSNLIFCCCIFSLCGFTFLSGFNSKEILLFSFIFSNINFFFVLCLVFTLFFTFIYSSRLLSILLKSMISYYSVSTSFILFFCSFILFFFGMFFGWWFVKNYFIYFSLVGGKEVLFLILFYFVLFFNWSKFFYFKEHKMFFQDIFYKIFPFLFMKNFTIFNIFLMKNMSILNFNNFLLFSSSSKIMYFMFMFFVAFLFLA